MSADTSNVRFQEAAIDRPVLIDSALWGRLEEPPTGSLRAHRRALRLCEESRLKGRAAFIPLLSRWLLKHF